MSDRARAEFRAKWFNGTLRQVASEDVAREWYLAGWKARGEADLKASKAACAVGDNHWAAIRALDVGPETKEELSNGD